MDHAGAVGGVECGADLLDHPAQAVVVEAAGEHRGFQRAAGDVAHHEVGAVGLAPVVVERHDVRVFEGGHGLRLGLEAADEVGLVGEFCADLLDRHRASERWLRAAPHERERALADHLVELVAAQHVLAM